MGAPAYREPSFDEEGPPSESGERLVELSFGTALGEVEEPATDEAGPWCVDFGSAILCYETVELWMALAAGKVTPEHKVWRDGRACWEPLADVPELMVEAVENVDHSQSRPTFVRLHREAPPSWTTMLRTAVPVALAVALLVGVAAGIWTALVGEADAAPRTELASPRQLRR